MFDFSKVKISWFPSHMARAMAKIRQRFDHLDLIIEVRDARAPFSSANPMLEEICSNRNSNSNKDRIVIFNKLDLADPHMNNLLAKYCLENSGTKTDYMLFTSNAHDSVVNLLKLVKSRIVNLRQGNYQKDPKVMVVGIPNVGKSTIINRLRSIGTDRGGRAVRTGAIPGITRTLSQRVCIIERPRIYMVDTPGILVPKIEDAKTGLTIGLIGGLLDRLVGEYLLAEYLIYTLNTLEKSAKYQSFYGIDRMITDVEDILPFVARHAKTIEKDGTINRTNTLCTFLKEFRIGSLGRVTLDSIPPT